MFMNSLLYIAWDIFFLVFYGTTLMNKKIFPFFCNTHKTHSYLELNLKQRLIVVDISLKIGEYCLSIFWDITQF